MKIPENIEAVSGLDLNYMGFIFYEKSPRNFQGELAQIPTGIKKTGVFVNASLDLILEKQKEYDLGALQLHGEETPQFVEKLQTALNKRQVSGIEIIKVFSVKDRFEFDRLKPYEGKVDYFLFDTKGINKGGNGICFDWEILKDYPSSTPFFLSGGIGPEEIDKINEFRHYLKGIGKDQLLYAVDVNSKFETSPGLKNTELLNSFQKKLKI